MNLANLAEFGEAVLEGLLGEVEREITDVEAIAHGRRVFS